MKITGKILLFLNFLIGIVLFIASFDEYSSFSRGDFMSNPITCMFAFWLNTTCLFVLLIDYSEKVIFFALFVLSAAINIVVIAENFTSDINADKFPHLLILILTIIYLTTTSVRKIFEKKKLVEI